MPRPTSLIAFKAPFVKGADCIAVPIQTGIGEWCELVGSPGTLRAFGAAIVEHFAGPDRRAGQRRATRLGRQPVLKPCRRIL